MDYKLINSSKHLGKVRDAPGSSGGSLGAWAPHRSCMHGKLLYLYHPRGLSYTVTHREEEKIPCSCFQPTRNHRAADGRLPVSSLSWQLDSQETQLKSKTKKKLNQPAP